MTNCNVLSIVSALYEGNITKANPVYINVTGK